jgi:uncharacterized protein
MPTIRDLVGALRQRDGVDAAIVLGRDGLLIDSQVASHVTADDVAALVPPVLSAAEELGRNSGQGELRTGVIEYAEGLALISPFSDDAILLVLLQPSANVGQILFELRRNRERLAALV